MIDPLGMTASILAILQITETVMSYLNDVRKASSDRASLAIEASSIYGLLIALRFRVEQAHGDDPWFILVRQLAVENGPLEQFKSTLEWMVAKIQPATGIAKVGKAFTWRFDKADVEDALRKMERIKSLVNLYLTNDLL
jgi:hypothetical protein